MSEHKFSKAIVRLPGHSMVRGISSTNIGLPDIEKATEQHREYTNALEKCGLEITILEPLEEFPDSVFIEDVALLTKNCAIITNPGAPSRRGEVKAMRSALSTFYKHIEFITDPGTVDAGDILHAKDHYFIGLSKRTNHEGANQVIGHLEKYGMAGSTIGIRNLLHLKSGVSYLGDGLLVVTGELIDEPQFRNFSRIEISDDENYAANCVRINDFVLIPDGFPRIAEKIKDHGFSIIELEMSEFRKLDGGLSCLSLRF